eukprot:gene5996-4301_t
MVMQPHKVHSNVISQHFLYPFAEQVLFGLQQRS